MPLRWERQTSSIEKPIVGIESIISEVIEEIAVKLVCPRASFNNDLSSGTPAILRGERRSLHTKLLKRVDRDQTARSTEGIEGLGSSSTSLTKSRIHVYSEIRANSVHTEIVRVCALTVDTELPGRTERAWCDDDPWRQL